MRSNSVQSRQSQHNFAQVPSATIPRSSFNRSFGVKTAFNSGYIVPVMVDEALPGDTFNCKMTAFARLSTPIFPLMDNMYLDTFFFAVPLRLIWDNFKKFMGEQANPGDSVSYLVPTMTSPVGGYVVGTLHDYLGLPTAGTDGVGAGNTVTHSSLFARAYALIYNEWFRDENMQNSITVDKGDGPDTYSNYVLQRRGKRHDYFTSALPFAQKGTAASIALTGNAPVVTNSTDILFKGASNATDRNVSLRADSLVGTTSTPGTMNARFGTNTGLQADLSSVTAATINDLRLAFAVQKMFERDARGGTRYTEIVRSHFSVISPDARLQRPEYLGGGSSPITITPVAQTSASAVSGSTTAMGSLAALGTVHVNNHGFTKSFVEHSIILGLVSIRADLSYQQGLDRMFSRSTRNDFYWPAFATLGEQAILNKEIYCKGDANDGLVFGYQERWAEYRYKPSKITGQMRSTFTTPLDAWHLGQKFTSLPALNSTFIVENPPVDRVIAVSSAPQFLFDSYFDLKCARPMPVYSVPGNIDRF